ncbi:MAG: hypothetical protein ACWA5L_06310 [bacterium]
MKELMIDMMAAMMPYMKLPMKAGFVLIAIALVLVVFRFINGSGKFMSLVGWLLVAIGGFFVICQLMGMWLGMGPTINFGDPKKFEFNTIEFWVIGTWFLLPGFVVLFLRPKNN